MPKFLVKLTECFYVEADSLEDAYSYYENGIDYIEVEEVEDDEDDEDD